MTSASKAAKVTFSIPGTADGNGERLLPGIASPLANRGAADIDTEFGDGESIRTSPGAIAATVSVAAIS